MNIRLLSKDIVEPTPTSKLVFVNCLEDFEKIEFDKNTTLFGFDNFKQCFYIRERNKFGEYSLIKIFFYEDIEQKVEECKRDEFIKKCKSAGLSDGYTKIAVKIYIDNMKNDEVWDWVLRNKIKDVELDTIKTIKWRIRKKLYPELIKHPKKKT